MQCKKLYFLEQTERAAKGDENSTTFRLWNGKCFGFAVATTLTGFEVWAQQCRKGTH